MLKRSREDRDGHKNIITFVWVGEILDYNKTYK